MPVYNKLVRDRIPEIIEKSGKTLTKRILSQDEFISEVNKKMHEELAEYEEAKATSEALEELADLLELIYAAAGFYGASFNEVEKIRKQKAIDRGGFKDKVFLMDVQDE